MNAKILANEGDIVITYNSNFDIRGAVFDLLNIFKDRQSRVMLVKNQETFKNITEMMTVFNNVIESFRFKFIVSYFEPDCILIKKTT